MEEKERKVSQAAADLVAHWISLQESEGLQEAGVRKVRKVLPKAKKKKDPNAESSRLLVGQAIQDENLDRLKELIEIEGLAVDLVAHKWSGTQIALSRCLSRGFFEGFVYLANKGAPRHWVKGKDGVVLTPGVNEEGQEVLLSELGRQNGLLNGSHQGYESLLKQAMSSGEEKFLEFLWDGESEKDKVKEAQNCGNSDSYEFLLKKGYAHHVSRENEDQLCVTFLDQFLDDFEETSKFSKPLSADGKKAAKHYKTLLEKASVQVRVKAWLQILLMDRLDVLSYVVKNGLSPTKESAITISPKDLYNCSYYLEIPESYGKSKKGVPNPANEPKVYGLEELVCLVSDRAKEKVLLKAVMSSSESRNTIANSQDCLWALSTLTHIDSLKHMKAQGFDLGTLVGESGNNPLHCSVQHDTSKVRAVELSKVYPDWIIQRNKKGHKPADMVKGMGFDVKFEEVIIKQAAGRMNRGKRTKALRM